jgi:hypothetical protein
MSDREDRLKSLLNKVRAKRPDERATHAADVLERIRAASGAVPAVQTAPATPPPATSALEPPTSPTIDSPTRYSSHPPRVERPLSVSPRARPSSGAPQKPSQSPSLRPDSVRAQSAVPTGQPIVYATDEPEFPRPKTFGDLLELTLSLRPR